MLLVAEIGDELESAAFDLADTVETRAIRVPTCSWVSPRRLQGVSRLNVKAQVRDCDLGKQQRVRGQGLEPQTRGLRVR
jgi:hypothetical protein